MLIEQLIKYGCVGVLSTLIHFCTASLFVIMIWHSLFFSNMIGFLVAYIWSYYAQSRFVFKSDLSCQKGVKFFFVQTLALILSVNIAGCVLNINIFLQVFICAIILPLCAFFIHKVWTFVDFN